jgi:hypothetical protein
MQPENDAVVVDQPCGRSLMVWLNICPEQVVEIVCQHE